MPQLDVWNVGKETVTISQLNLGPADTEALERHLLELSRLIPQFVVAVSALPYGNMKYSNVPGQKGVTQVRVPNCGHEYIFSDRYAFVRPACSGCDAWLAKKVKENPRMWFSESVTKPTTLDRLKAVLKEGERKEVTKNDSAGG